MGLRSITENVLMETMFVVPSIPDVHTVYLDASAVRGERKPVLLKDINMTVEKYEYLMKNKKDSNDDNSDEYLFDGVDMFLWMILLMKLLLNIFDLFLLGFF